MTGASGAIGDKELRALLASDAAWREGHLPELGDDILAELDRILAWEALAPELRSRIGVPS